MTNCYSSDAVSGEEKVGGMGKFSCIVLIKTFGYLRGDFSKNSGILQLMKMGPFLKVSCVQSFAIWLVVRTGPRNSDNRLNSIATCGTTTHRSTLREGISPG